MELAAILLVAVAVDLTFGEPPTRLHPVGWMGQLVVAMLPRAPGGGRKVEFAWGVAIVAVLIVVTFAISYTLLVVAADWNRWVYFTLAALLFKTTFSVSELLRAALRVKLCLLDNSLEAARREMRALVSRNTSRLEAQHLAAATIESLAENSVDSFVAPVFYFALFAWSPPLAITAAVCYRAANTMDAMLGYRGKYEYLGKAAARCDDLLNWVPARLGACIMIAAATLFGDARGAWQTLWRDRTQTASPNAGWPMSAMAGALSLRLEKVGHYSLGQGAVPAVGEIARASRLALATMLGFAALVELWLVTTK